MGKPPKHYTCGDCSREFDNPGALASHAVNVHGGEPSPLDVVRGRKGGTGDLEKTVDEDK